MFGHPRLESCCPVRKETRAPRVSPTTPTETAPSSETLSQTSQNSSPFNQWVCGCASSPEYYIDRVANWLIGWLSDRFVCSKQESPKAQSKYDNNKKNGPRGYEWDLMKFCLRHLKVWNQDPVWQEQIILSAGFRAQCSSDQSDQRDERGSVTSPFTFFHHSAVQPFYFWFKLDCKISKFSQIPWHSALSIAPLIPSPTPSLPSEVVESLLDHSAHREFCKEGTTTTILPIQIHFMSNS